MEVISSDKQSSSPPGPSHLKNIILVASLAAGIQFGWALQLSLLTPYVQLLGIPHKWASIIWLCGPISGMIVQPLTGYYSDNCNSKFGRRRPFIAAGSACVLIAVVLIGYAADLGKLFGDDITKTPKKRAIAIFVVGFWILDVANNMLQGPCRAFLADLCGHNQKKTRSANAFYSFFMAVGNVLGYAAGSWTHLYRLFPFTHTAACDVYCANLKSCFFLSIALLLIVTVLALSLVPEKALSAGNEEGDKEEAAPPMGAFIGEIFDALKGLERPMWVLLLVTCLNWIAWFPFTLFDTDWMGREVYGGDAGGDAGNAKMYDLGVRMGSFGLMLNSVVLGLMSLGVEYLGRRMGGAKRLWGAVNFLLAICLALMVLITKVAESNRRYITVDGKQQLQQPPMGVTVAALAVFSVLGIPLAVTYSIPFALASIFTNASNSAAGQGLSLGVMNIAIVVPQMIVSVAAGPFDALFGGGNLPAFVAGAVSAAASAVLAFTMLPSPPSDAHAAAKNVDVFP